MKHDLWRKGSESLDVTSLWRDEAFHTCPGDGDCLREEFMQNGIPNEQALGFLLKWIFAEFCNKTILENTAGFFTDNWF